MKKIGCFAVLLFVFYGRGTSHQFGQHQADSQPNILLITADDLGIQLGCYGDSIAQTPHLDQLAKEGIKFNNAYVTQASCSPSRSSMFTGLYPHQNGQVGLSHRGFSMVKNIPNIFSFFKRKGYRTGIIGKLHVQPAEEFPFDYEDTNAKKTRDVRQVAHQAREFIHQEEKPFLLSLNYFDPHVPFLEQVEGLPEKPYQAKDVHAFAFQKIDVAEEKERIAGFYNCVKRLDQGIGYLMEMLQNEGILDNTIIIFLGDHGAPFTRGKTGNYESSVKVPFIVRYPKKVQPGLVSASLISTIDIFPTLLDLAEYTPEITFEGRSLVPVFADPGKDLRKYLFTEFTYHTHFSFFPRRAVRGKQFKLIHNIKFEADPILQVDGDNAYTYSQKEQYEGTIARQIFDRMANPPEYELYDLKKDPHEYDNIADDPQYQDELEVLKNELFAWRKATHDPLLYTYIEERMKGYEKSEKIQTERGH